MSVSGRSAVVYLILALFIVAGCGGGNTGPDTADTSPSGAWVGRAATAANVGLWRFTLSESAGIVSGTYTVLSTQPGQLRQVAVDGVVAGQYDSPSLSLSFPLTLEVFMECEYDGAMAADGQSIDGRITCRTGSAVVANGTLRLARSAT